MLPPLSVKKTLARHCHKAVTKRSEEVESRSGIHHDIPSDISLYLQGRHQGQAEGQAVGAEGQDGRGAGVGQQQHKLTRWPGVSC